jgi:hypothetical protein
MTVAAQIKTYIATLPEPKRSEVQQLHQLTKGLQPKLKLWYYDGRDSNNKVVANPNIGYGEFTIKYADGKTKEWFRVGISTNTTGISVYIMGLEDKTYLARTYGKKLGKATVTGYCIKFKTLKDIDLDTLLQAIQYRLGLDE